MDNSKNSSQGIGIFTLLFLIFLVLKLCNVIDWSWWWVTAPLWGVFALIFGVVFSVFFIVLFASLFRKKKK